MHLGLSFSSSLVLGGLGILHLLLLVGSVRDVSSLSASAGGSLLEGDALRRYYYWLVSHSRISFSSHIAVILRLSLQAFALGSLFSRFVSSCAESSSLSFMNSHGNLNQLSLVHSIVSIIVIN